MDSNYRSRVLRLVLCWGEIHLAEIGKPVARTNSRAITYGCSEEESVAMLALVLGLALVLVGEHP